jgi:hypothetical protein
MLKIVETIAFWFAASAIMFGSVCFILSRLT